MITALNKLINPLKRRVYAMIGRAIIELVNDSQGIQATQVSLRGETQDDVPHLQQYGFTSHPLPGAEGVVLSLAANSSNTVIIAVDDRRFRLKSLQEGEVAIYDDQGSYIHLKRGGDIDIKSATKVFVDAPLLEGAGDIADVIGTLNELRQDFIAHVADYGDHKHISNGTGVATGPPIVGPA